MSAVWGSVGSHEEFVAAVASDPVMLTLREAGELVNLGQSRMHALVRDGHVDAVKVDGLWLVDARSLLEYRIGMLAQHCGDRWSIDVENARRCGTLSVSTADRLAVTVLGMTLWELWPDELAESA